MSLPVFQATIVNDSGDIIPSAVITVLDEITGLGLTVYSNRAGTVPLGTNGVFTAGTDGFAQFFAPTGNYRVKAEQAASGFEKTWDFVPLVGTAAFVDTDYFGTAATANVQTSSTDTTAGALMKVGAFSLGGFTNNNTSINTGSYDDILTTGFYGVASAVTESPFGASGDLIVVGRSSTYTQQIYLNPLGTQVYIRRQDGGIWSEWQPVYTEANLNPNVFGVNGVNDAIKIGTVTSTTTAIFDLPSLDVPQSITVNGTFNVVTSGYTTRGASITPTLAGSSSDKTALIVCTISGGVIGESVLLRSDSSASKITVNS